jgi:hypothetical protein
VYNYSNKKGETLKLQKVEENQISAPSLKHMDNSHECVAVKHQGRNTTKKILKAEPEEDNYEQEWKNFQSWYKKN